MTAPAVSVCVLAYNHEKYIRDCLMSVLAQADGLDLEILVGDDQSSDATSQIVADLALQHPKLIRHYRHARRLGGTGNNQFLVRAAAGACIAHLDGDDFWLPGKLRAQLEFLAANPDCTAVYSNAIVVNDDRRLLGVFNAPQPAKLDLGSLLVRGNFLHTSSLLFRASQRHLLLEIGEQFIDYRIHLRLARHGLLGYLNQPLTAYRAGSSSSIITHANDQIRECYWQALLDVPPELVQADVLTRGMADFLRRVVFRAVRAGSPGLARAWTRRVLEHSPSGALRTLWLTACNVTGTASMLLLDWVGRRLSRTHLKVFYR